MLRGITMYLNDEQRILFKEELMKLKKEVQISDYTFNNIIRWMLEKNIECSNIADLNFVYKELSRIECNILKYPYLKKQYSELNSSITKIEDIKSYCDVLSSIARLDLAMGLEINSRIASGIDSTFYISYYMPITSGNFKDPMYAKKQSK
jgi:hypothetical protein